MTDQSESTAGTNDDALWLGTGLLVGGAIVYLVGTRILDFISFGTKEPVSFSDLGGSSFMGYIWFGLMIGGAVGYYRNRGDELSRGVKWRYRAAVWLGTLHSVGLGLNLLGWWFQPALAIKYYWASIARQHGLNPNMNLLSTEDFQPLADTVSYYWLGNTVMFVGLAMLAMGVWAVWQCRKEYLAALTDSD